MHIEHTHHTHHTRRPEACRLL